MRWFRASFFGLCLCSSSVWAAEFSPELFLRRTAQAARDLNYQGVYVHGTADRMQSYELRHWLDDDAEHERRRALDGEEQALSLDESRLSVDARSVGMSGGGLRQDRRLGSKLFPRLLPQDSAALLQTYSVQYLKDERVAGLPAKAYLLQPKDKYRYPYRLWVEPSSGLLLKSAMLSPDGETLEQFSFTQVRIDAPPRESKPLKLSPGAALGSPSMQGETWQLNNLPLGFVVIKRSERATPGGGSPMVHLVFSDGLATVSMFIESGSGASRLPLGYATGQAMHGLAREVHAHRVVVLGEVPEVTIQQFVNAFSLNPTSTANGRRP